MGYRERTLRPLAPSMSHDFCNIVRVSHPVKRFFDHFLDRFRAPQTQAERVSQKNHFFDSQAFPRWAEEDKIKHFWGVATGHLAMGKKFGEDI